MKWKISKSIQTLNRCTQCTVYFRTSIARVSDRKSIVSQTLEWMIFDRLFMLKLQTITKFPNESGSNIFQNPILTIRKYRPVQDSSLLFCVCNWYNLDYVTFGRLPHIFLTAQYKRGTLPHGNIFASLLDYMHWTIEHGCWQIWLRNYTDWHSTYNTDVCWYVCYVLPWTRVARRPFQYVVVRYMHYYYTWWLKTIRNVPASYTMWSSHQIYDYRR